MFAELVCREMNPAKWHAGASTFKGTSTVVDGASCISGYFNRYRLRTNGAPDPAFQLGSPIAATDARVPDTMPSWPYLRQMWRRTRIGPLSPGNAPCGKPFLSASDDNAAQPTLVPFSRSNTVRRVLS